MGIKTFIISDHGLRKGYLFLIKNGDINILITRSRVKKRLLSLIHTTEKDKISENKSSDRDINQHPARFSNLINQNQIPDPNYSVQCGHYHKQR